MFVIHKHRQHMDSFVSPFTKGQIVAAQFKGQVGSSALAFLSPTGYLTVPFPGDTDSFSIAAGPTLDKQYTLIVTDISDVLPTAAIMVDIT